MIGYVTVGTNDLDKGRQFYADLLGSLGATELMRFESGATIFGTAFDKPCVCVLKPFDGKPATVGNGMMVSFAAGSRAMVDKLHAKALKLGGKDEGAPGLRGPEGPQAFYGAYFRDLDGNKLCAFHIGS
jgi:catechol 2,3-dioxygenase-like lactoylglutathione lyase family enzyme